MILFQRQNIFLENVFLQLRSALLHLIDAKNIIHSFYKAKISDQRVYVMKKVCDDGDEITSQTGDINGG
jgi:hypothetical protein